MSMFLHIEEESNRVHIINLSHTTRVTMIDNVVTVVYQDPDGSGRERDKFTVTDDWAANNLRCTLRKLGVK